MATLDKLMPEVPRQQDLLTSLDKIGFILDKHYLNGLQEQFQMMPFDIYNRKPNGGYKIIFKSNMRAVRIARWVYEQDEKISDRFKNIISVFARSDSTLAAIVTRTPTKSEMFFILKNETSNYSKVEESSQNQSLLISAIEGNFPGTIAEPFTPDKDWFGLENAQSIACLTNVGSQKSEDYLSQGLEKILDGIVPRTEEESYTIVILAEPLSPWECGTVLSGYEELASALYPFSAYQFGHGKSQQETAGEFTSLSNSESVNQAVSKMHTISLGAFGFVGIGEAGGAGLNGGYTHSRGTVDGVGTSVTDAEGKNYSLATGINKNATYNYKSFTLANMLEKIEHQMKRVQAGQALGLWKCASYVIARNAQVSLDVAYSLRALTQGDSSYIENSALNHWMRHGENSDFEDLKQYLLHCTHPIFAHQRDLAHNANRYDDEKVLMVTPTAHLSTSEVAMQISFPRRSVAGLPALSCARFGRGVMCHNNRTNRKLPMGRVFHMHKVERAPVELDIETLTSHTFITGSTGSGKSNTIYTLINNACFSEESKIKFLVIEPAKGEYKRVFGGRDGVFVYGTNPGKAPLLRLNPFSFPEDIHVLEHVDRLVEIFNACWPMYAAMPAVLKDAIEAAYREVGWNLTRSVCSPPRYPTFSTVMEKLPEIIRGSAYSQDTKGDYIGALVTRVKSLTNGINGLIFSSDEEIPNEKLFEENVIIDLSRVGSVETKALLMGIMIMKLQEYRLATGDMNAQLKHITVLEEAHNLLRKTSLEQSQESSNLQGKSVEMLTNAIAEMRTYGEGFIIADQSPGLLDLSVIRNTNTKIIMNLPDESDRLLVGRAAGLADEQIVELSKLRRGVAVFYQNDWLEPVLCAVDHFQDEYPFEYEPVGLDETISLFKTKVLQNILRLGGIPELSEEEMDALEHWIDDLSMGKDARGLLEKTLYHNVTLTAQETDYLLYCLVRGRSLLSGVANSVHPSNMGIVLDNRISEQLEIDPTLATSVRKSMLRHAVHHMEADSAFRKELLIHGGIIDDAVR